MVICGLIIVKSCLTIFLGVTNDYKGYLYVTKNYVKYKTTAFLLHKGGIPAAISKKLGL